MNKGRLNQLYPISIYDGKFYLLLFILWPFLAFCVALFNYSSKQSRKVIYFFFIYFGLTFFIHGHFYFDAVGYATRLAKNAALPFSDFFEIVGGLYATDTSVDVVEPFLSFLVSRFTDDYRILFAVFAAVFGYFYLRSFDLLYNQYKKNTGLNSSIHLAFFSVIIPVTAISGFRMWTAAWIFFLGAYHVVLNNDRRFILLALSSTLVHWSFLSANVILIIYYLAGNRNYIYLPLAIVSFFVPQLFFTFFQRISFLLGGALQSRYDSYSDENFRTSMQEYLAQSSWFVELSTKLVFYYLLFAICFIQLRYKDLLKEQSEKNLYSFVLLFLVFVNFGIDIPSFGTRFQVVFFMFATLYLFLFFLKMPRDKINFLTVLGLFPMLLYAVLSFRQASEFISAWIFTPGLLLPFFDEGISVAEILFH